MRAAFAMNPELPEQLFTSDQLDELRRLVEIETGSVITDLTQEEDSRLDELEILVTGWQAPWIGDRELRRMPRLRAIVHTAGTTRNFASEAVWSRQGLRVTNAAQANAVPVAEFSLAQILLAGKQSVRREAAHRAARGHDGGWSGEETLGNFGASVGLIGASRIGSLVAQYLRPFDLDVMISDPVVADASILALGARPVSLEELFSSSTVVSLHAPDVPSTQGMVSAPLLASMHDGATFLNTARPALVDEAALRRELVSGRLSAVLDVHDDLAAEDPLWDLPNVSITPHLAGSQGNELHRLADHALEEVRRLVAGRPARHLVDPALLVVSA